MMLLSQYNNTTVFYNIQGFTKDKEYIATQGKYFHCEVLIPSFIK